MNRNMARPEMKATTVKTYRRKPDPVEACYVTQGMMDGSEPFPWGLVLDPKRTRQTRSVRNSTAAVVAAVWAPYPEHDIQCVLLFQPIRDGKCIATLRSMEAEDFNDEYEVVE